MRATRVRTILTALLALFALAGPGLVADGHRHAAPAAEHVHVPTCDHEHDGTHCQHAGPARALDDSDAASCALCLLRHGQRTIALPQQPAGAPAHDGLALASDASEHELDVVRRLPASRAPPRV